MHSDFDWLLVGGGLQNALIALAVKERWPQARIAIVERERALGGSHLWCFHAADLPVECAPFVGPLVAHRWESYEVHFPSYQRRFELPYAAISSARLDAVVRSRLADGGSAVFLGTEAEAVGAREVRLADGRTLTAKAVVDARGPSQLDGLRVAGYQKFVGLEIELGRAHGIERPILMDATVPQLDGFRFVYALPMGPTRVLVEDTYYSESARLDRPAVAERVLEWARERGIEGGVVRQEHGVLPLPLAVPRIDAALPLRAGYGGGWLHPTTGYSFPAAVRLARYVAEAGPEGLPGEGWRELAASHRRQLWFGVMLNRALFGAFEPGDRRNVFEQFNRLPAETIARFYALRIRPKDAFAILRRAPPGLSVRKWGQATFSPTTLGLSSAKK